MNWVDTFDENYFASDRYTVLLGSTLSSVIGGGLLRPNGDLAWYDATLEYEGGPLETRLVCDTTGVEWEDDFSGFALQIGFLDLGTQVGGLAGGGFGSISFQVSPSDLGVPTSQEYASKGWSAWNPFVETKDLTEFSPAISDRTIDMRLAWDGQNDSFTAELNGQTVVVPINVAPIAAALAAEGVPFNWPPRGHFFPFAQTWFDTSLWSWSNGGASTVIASAGASGAIRRPAVPQSPQTAGLQALLG